MPVLKGLTLENFNDEIQYGLFSDRLLVCAEEAYISTILEDRGICNSIINYFLTHLGLLNDKRIQENI